MKLFGLFILLSLFSGCGELDTVLPSTGTYQVKALVNGNSLDERSLINGGDAVRPYFASSVTKDPDVTGLMVSLQNAGGESLGGKILYTLKLGENTVGFKTIEEIAQETSKNLDGGGAAEPPKLRIGSTDTLIPASRLDKDLPAFLMPEDLAIGQYSLVFRIIGAKETLSQIEKSFYYLGNAVFSLKEIQMYLPSVSSGPRLVAPDAVVLLEARLDFDSRLDPYIMWYNGKKLISEGKLSEGGATLLWKAPDQSGFHSLRAEAFPFKIGQGIAGSSREIAIPVSSKTAAESLVSGDSSELFHWYRFGGSLTDSKPPMSPEWTLVSQGGSSSQWRPVGYNYGLAAGPGNVYLLPPVGFFRNGEREGSGQFLFRFKPVSEGCIVSALFASRTSPEKALEMNLYLKDEKLVLRLSTSALPVEEITMPFISSPGEYTIAAIDFSIRQDRFEAVLSRVYSELEPVFQNDKAVEDMAVKIGLAAPLSGECSLKFGASGTVQEVSKQAVTTAIWDEFAILYSGPTFVAKGLSMVQALLKHTSPGEETQSL